MNRTIRHILTLLAVMPLTLSAQEHTVKVVLDTPAKTAQTDKPMVVRLSDVEGLNFRVRSAVVKIGGKEVASQLDDMDGDGQSDELCFVCDQEKGQKLAYEITFSARSSQTTYPARVYADMMLNDKKGKHPLFTRLEAPGDSYLYSDLYHHGAAFESELTAYRIYFDERQNIDIYGKQNRQLELRETGFYATAEQMAAGYGCDVLWAGSSVGCGSLKLWDGQKPVNWTAVKTRGQRLVASGPVRTVVEVTDLGCEVGAAEPYDVRTVYTLWAGHREVEVDVWLDRPVKTPFLCTGVQKIGNSEEAFSKNGGVKSEGFVTKEGLAASWGADYPEMGKKEVYPPEAVGLAVSVPQEFVSTTLTDELNYLVVIGKPGQQHFRYHVLFGAAKEKEGCHNAAEWFRHVRGLKF